LQSDRSILLECRIPATNRETLARFSPQTGCLARTSADAPATGTCGSYVMVAVAAYGRMSETHVHDDSCCLTMGIGKWIEGTLKP